MADLPRFSYSANSYCILSPLELVLACGPSFSPLHDTVDVNDYLAFLFGNSSSLSEDDEKEETIPPKSSLRAKDEAQSGGAGQIVGGETKLTSQTLADEGRSAGDTESGGKGRY
uniref:Uncharacterized protein n=1 Tax=Trichuris muris TaxID=70415 RepID=A0A5S6QJI8_TRIMR